MTSNNEIKYQYKQLLRVYRENNDEKIKQLSSA